MTNSTYLLRACCTTLVLIGLSGGASLRSQDAGGAQLAGVVPPLENPASEPLVPLVLTQIESIDEAPPVPNAQERTPPGTPPLAVTQLDEGGDRLDALDGDQRLSLRFGEPMPITELLLFLFRDTPFSIVPEPDVEGHFIGELKNVTLLEALDLVLHPHGLDYAVQNSSIAVFRRRLETRIFPVDHVMTRRSRRSTFRGLSGWSAAAGAGSGPVSSMTELVDQDDGDLFEELSAGVRTLLSADGRFNVDRKAALLQVTDSADRVARVATYLAAVSSRVNRQVLLEAEVAEVELHERFSGGIDWEAIRAIVGAGSLRAGAGGVRVAVPHNGSAALLAALRTQGRVNVLAKPRVVTMHNEAAVMQVGTQDVFFASTAQEAGSGQFGGPQVLTEGLILSVTPQIGPDGVISMSISPRLTQRSGSTHSDRGGEVPVLSVRAVDTVVRVFEGETVVVAGLMKDRVITTRGKVPGVGSIPLLGRMFRRNRTVSTKTDLVILMTPRVVAPGQLTAALTRH